MNPRDRIRLQHLADALNSAIRFARGRERGDLDSHEMLLFSLVRAVEIAGEAARLFTDRAAGAYPPLLRRCGPTAIPVEQIPSDRIFASCRGGRIG